MKILKDSHLFTPQRKKDGSSGFFCCPTHAPRSVRQYLIPSMPGQMIFTTEIYQSQISYPDSYRRWGRGFFSLEIVLEGELLVRNDDRFYVAEAGDIFLMHAGSFTEFLLAPDGKCRKMSIAFYGPLVPDFFERSGLGGFDILEKRPVEKISSVIRRLIDLAGSRDLDAGFLNEIETYRVLQLLMQEEEDILIPKKYADLHQYILLHPEETFSISSMAENCGCSKAFFLRNFKKYYKQTPHQFLLETRMRRACFLLQGGNRSMKEISSMCGFSDQLNFSAAFRKKYGLSPRKYREKEIGEKQKNESLCSAGTMGGAHGE